MQNQIKQVWIPYWKWEDWKNGMWKKKVENESQLLESAIEFTGNAEEYGNAMREVVKLWPNTMVNSLTNKSINQRAFVGHCAVCYKLGIPEYITRKAWKHLTQKQRDLADHEAQQTIYEWKRKYISTLKIGNQSAIKKDFQMKLQLS